MLFKKDFFTFYFGDKQDQIDKNLYETYKDNYFLKNSCFDSLKKRINSRSFFFLKQTHSTLGIVLDKENIKNAPSFSFEGDYIITKLQNIAIGVMTADCLPIIFYDKENHTAAVAHAGWRGSAKMIAKKVVQQMNKEFQTKQEDFQVFFGPSAKVCCYKVGDEVISALKKINFLDDVIVKKNNDFYFDLPLLNKKILLQSGVASERINMQYNLCTICNDDFCSYRRKKGDPYRQMSVISLLAI